MGYVEMAVDQLTPTLLNWVVARCEGFNPVVEGTEIWLYPKQSTMPSTYVVSPTAPNRIICQLYNPVEVWDEAGYIITRENIWFTPTYEGDQLQWVARSMKGNGVGRSTNQLVAMMQCYVIGKVGETVSVPDVLTF